jgi:hypothetical protein
MSPTRAQIWWLKKAVAEGELRIGGIDASRPQPQWRICRSLRDAGLLTFYGTWSGTSFRPTEAGRELAARR